jgi:hypothetical protein
VELQELQIELRNLDPYLGKYIEMKTNKKDDLIAIDYVFRSLYNFKPPYNMW